MSKIDKFIQIDALKQVKTIIVKIGSSSLTHETGKLNLKRIETLVRVLSDLSNSGKEVILVSSGAVSAGVALLELTLPLERIEDKKAAAAAGQAELMNIYSRFFSDYGKKVAQILITKDVIENEVRRCNTEETFGVLLKLGCIPIVNENDTVSSDEIKFSGNDILASYVAILCNDEQNIPPLLVNLSDVDGLYDKNPSVNSDAVLIQRVPKITDEVLAYAGGAGSVRGTGGMITKLQAAQIAAEYNIPMIITNAQNLQTLYDVLDGRVYGTIIGA